MRFPLLLLAVLLSVPACAQQPPGVVGSPVAATPTPAAQTLKTVSSQAGEIAVQEMVAGLDHPWGMDFLPDGRLLVTERDSGKLLLVSPDGQRQEVTGVPEVVARGQGGLMDVAAHPDFAANGWVYLSYAAPAEGRQSATTLGRGKLVEGRLEGFQVLFSQDPVAGGTHFGNRIVLTKDGYLFLATGERFQFTPAQDLGQTLGKVIRLKDDGTIPEGNPFVGQQGARPEIWSYGHRNIEAAVLHPQTGALWIAEMGPKGGDELNLIEAGKNYGWPLVSWGDNYDNSPIPKPSTRPDLTTSA